MPHATRRDLPFWRGQPRRIQPRAAGGQQSIQRTPVPPLSGYADLLGMAAIDASHIAAYLARRTALAGAATGARRAAHWRKRIDGHTGNQPGRTSSAALCPRILACLPRWTADAAAHLSLRTATTAHALCIYVAASAPAAKIKSW